MEKGRIELPAWMETQADDIAAVNWGRKRSHNFLGKSIRSMQRALAEGMLAEEYAGRDGWLQRLDPRLKTILAILLIIVTGFTRSIPLLLAIWGFTALLMIISKLPLLVLQKRIWGFIPLLTLIISVPAMFNLIIGGTPLLVVYQSSQPTTWLGIHIPANIYISRQGVMAGLYLFSRVGLSLTVGVLLTITTPVAQLLKSLRVMGMPALMVMIIEMSYRYLVLLLNLSIEMFEARNLRTVGVLSMASKRAQVGSSMAALFARSLELADEVYLAMTARGYTGQAVSASRKPN
jgi:cobalt ABC transporter, permease protein CbiQ